MFNENLQRTLIAMNTSLDTLFSQLGELMIFYSNITESSFTVFISPRRISFLCKLFLSILHACYIFNYVICFLVHFFSLTDFYSNIWHIDKFSGDFDQVTLELVGARDSSGNE